MNKCALYITEAMQSMESKMEQLESKSVNRENLRRRINRELVIKVKLLVELTPEESELALEHLFKEQLNLEIVNGWK